MSSIHVYSWNGGCYFENNCKAAAVYTKQAYWGASGIAPLLCLGSKWEVSGQLYSRSYNHQWPLYRRLGGPQGWSGRFEEEEECCPCHKSNTGSYGP